MLEWVLLRIGFDVVSFVSFQCSKHGEEFIEYKCRYCCSAALFYCFGTTHFCNGCHNAAGQVARNKPITCPAGPNRKKLKGPCPLGFKHPPTGEEFCMGCRLCPSDKFILDNVREEMETD